MTSDADPSRHNQAQPFIAPPTKRSPPTRPRDPTAPGDRAAYSVFSLRLTEDQLADLRALAVRTGIPAQSHVRRAVIDYLHLFEESVARKRGL